MKFLCHLYIAVCCIYALQGTLFEEGGKVAHTLFAVVTAVSFTCFLVALVRYRLPSVLRVLSVLLLAWMLYGAYNMYVGNGVEWYSDYMYLRNILYSLLPVFAFYLFAKEGGLTESGLRRWMLVFVLLCMAEFSSVRDERLAAAAAKGMVMDEITNNSGYLFLSLFPLLPLWNRRPLLQYLLWGVCMAFVLFSVKRGAIMIAAVCSVWLVLKAFSSHQRTREKLWRLLLTGLLVVVAIRFVQEFIQSSQLFMVRLEELLAGNSSGRDTIYRQYARFFFDQTGMLPLLFGNGADATLRLFGRLAHNDWLEIGIDNGMLMVALYLVYWVSLFAASRRAKGNNTCHMMLGLFLIIYFLRTIFSMSYNDVSFFSASAMGFALANMENGYKGSFA